jgi:hypothetical protein
MSTLSERVRICSNSGSHYAHLQETLIPGIVKGDVIGSACDQRRPSIARAVIIVPIEYAAKSESTGKSGSDFFDSE